MVMDMRMMFGCRAAANWAQRGSGALSWLVQQASGGACLAGGASV